MDWTAKISIAITLSTLVAVALCVSILQAPATHQHYNNHHQQEQQQQIAEEMIKVIEQSLKCHDNPGLTVAIVKDGKTILSQGFGVTDPRTQVPVTSSTKYSVASLTKAFTAALLVHAVAKNGSVSMTSTIQDVVGGDFRFYDSERTQHATLEDLLSHRLRIPPNDAMRFNTENTRHALLQKIQYLEGSDQFRVGATYSSINYIMAAAITEIVSGRKWEELMNETIFSPLGMTTSDFAADVDFTSKNVAPPYITYNDLKAPIDPAFTKSWDSQCGSGCIFSTADDMAKWMTFHLNKGKDAQGHQLFPEDEMEALYTPQSIIPSSRYSRIQRPTFPVSENGDVYSLGWRLGYYRDYKILLHSGSTPGYASWLFMIPSEKLGIFIAMNGDDDAYLYRQPLQVYLTDVVLGEKPWLNVSTICSYPSPWLPHTEHPLPVYDVDLKPAHDWSKYSGVYRNDAYGDIHIQFNSTVNGLTARFGLGHWQLYPQKTKNEFYGKGLDILFFWDVNPFLFKEDSNSGDIDNLVVEGFEIHLAPVFKRIDVSLYQIGTGQK